MAVAIVGIVMAGQLARRRREAMAQLARDLGWRFWPQDDGSISSEFPKLGLFDHGRQRYAYNTLTGTIAVAGGS